MQSNSILVSALTNRSSSTRREGFDRAAIAFEFGSKAETLFRIREKAKSFVVLPIEIVAYSEWHDAKSSYVDRLLRRCEFSFPMIVRSSASREDALKASCAGEFLSVLSVADSESLTRAITDVFCSYGEPSEDDQVLVQPMADDIVLSGVAMTRDSRTGCPYIVLNYSDGSNTTTVTAGSDAVKSCIFLPQRADLLPPKLRNVAAALEEVRAIVHDVAVDVEFGVCRAGHVVIFQVRPIVLARDESSTGQGSHIGFLQSIGSVEASIREVSRFSASKGLSNPIFGVMPDWNPAEMIGTKPKPLAYSLYRHLITDSAWSTARAALGYRDLRGIPLMHMFGGTPYINVAASISSFIPNKLEEGVASRIVTDAIRRLAAYPELHDKVEFSIVPTCYTPTLNGSAWRACFPSLSDNEWLGYNAALRDLTNNLAKDEGAFARLEREIPRLEQLFAERKRRRETGLLEALSLLETARCVGTPLFAGVARAAFVATSIIQSFAAQGCFGEDCLNRLTRDADAIGSRIVSDFAELPHDAFLERHGHVRPGTYDITVPRYDDSRADYFGKGVLGRPSALHSEAWDLGPNDASHLDSLLTHDGFAFGWKRLRSFAISAIRAREYVKYLFSALVSDALEAIASVGAEQGISREDLSFLALGDILAALDAGGGSESTLLLSIAIRRNRSVWDANQLIRLPDLITNPVDVYCFECAEPSPTFVSDRTVEANVTGIDSRSLEGKVIFIESADPGFDWLFTHPIAGFVTKFGGENSHMSIRAREFDLPAVIGAGSRYDIWREARRLRIDCAAKRVDVVA